MHESCLRVLVGTKVRNAVNSEENKSLDMEEFDALNESIVTAKADDAECQVLQRDNTDEKNNEESYIGNRIVKLKNHDKF